MSPPDTHMSIWHAAMILLACWGGASLLLGVLIVWGALVKDLRSWWIKRHYEPIRAKPVDDTRSSQAQFTRIIRSKQ